MFTCAATERDMNMARGLIKGFVSSAETLNVSCKIGDRVVKGIPEEFCPKCKRRFLDSNIIEYVYSGKDPDSGLVMTAECLEYLDFPVVEWTLWIENTGGENSPVISDFYGADGFLKGDNPVIISNNGDTTQADLYTDTITKLNEAKSFSQSPDGGRGSDCAWPYYRVLCDGFGYNIAIGWPGQWKSEFYAADGGFAFRAGQQYARFYLKPGEKVRTPRITLMTFEGGKERGVNMWRRWMTAHVVPRPNGRVQEPFFALSDEENNVVFFTKTTEKRELGTLENLKSNEIIPEVYWVDAGWYPCVNADGASDWTSTGALHADEERFPNGFKAVSDKCREYGAKFLLWFEPERIKLSHQSDEYPDRFVIKLKDTSVLEHVRLTGIDPCHVVNTGLMNLADEECREWLTNHIDGLIKEYGIDVYRQDFNFPPLNWWLQNDEGEDRLGITENLYNQGYLKMWDELLLRNPGLLINSVSSGGRRSDLESLRRSVSLHQSDYGFGQHPIHQAIMTTSFEWQPFCGTQARNHDTEDGEYNFERPYDRPYDMQNFDNFAAHNAFCPAVYPNRVGMRSLDLPDGEFAETDEGKYYKKFREIWKRAVPYTLCGDFYVLQMTDRTNKCYHAVQFHDEERNEGIIQVIRNTKCERDALTVYPRGILEDREYIFESPEFGLTLSFSGRELNKNGFTVSIPKRSGEIWFYRAKA